MKTTRLPFRAVAAAAVLMLGPLLAAAPGRDDGGGSIAEAKRQLAREAMLVLEGSREARSSSSFAEEFGLRLPAEAVITRILSPQHKNPYVDAYVRWQLTGFVDALPPLGPSRFNEFLDALPPLARNPHADPEFVQALSEVRSMAPLSEEQRSRCQQLLDKTEMLAGRAVDLNEPGERLRQWVIEHLDDVRALEATLEYAETLLAAGWEVERLKKQIERRFAALDGPTLAASDRERLERRAEALMRQRSVYVRGARLTGTTVSVQHGEAAVYDFEIRAWLRAVRATD